MIYEQAKELLVSAMKNQSYAADTQKKFKASLTYICSFHNKYMNVETISPDEIQSFLNHLAFEKDLSPSTVNNYQAALKFLFEYVLHKTWPGEFSYFKIPQNKISPQYLKAKSYHSNEIKRLPLDNLIPIFIKQMELRGTATGTQAAYLRAVRKFASFTKKEDYLCQISLEDVQDFLHHEHYISKLNPQTINTYRTAIKLFYITILNKEWHDLKVPSYKLEKRIPIILSPDEVITLLNAIENPLYKMISLNHYLPIP